MASPALFDSLYCTEEHREEPGGKWREQSQQHPAVLNHELLSLFQEFRRKETAIASRYGYGVAAGREAAVGWASRAAARLGFSALTAALATAYLDRCFLGGALRMTRLAAVACVVLAAKVQETCVPLLVDLQLYAAASSDDTCLFEVKTVRRMELFVLSALGWQMHPITPFSYLQPLLAGAAVRRHHCESVLLAVMADWRWSRHRPSAWAAAALIATASKGDDDSELLALINGPEDEVTECAKLISVATGTCLSGFSWEPVKQQLVVLNDELPALFEAFRGKEGMISSLDTEMVDGYGGAAVREAAVLWAFRAAVRLGFSAVTVAVATAYMDRCFLCGVFRLDSQPWMPRLVAGVCVMLAAKVKETRLVMLVDRQLCAAAISDDRFVFETRTVRRMELLVLSALARRMHPVTPFSYLEPLLADTAVRRHHCESVLLAVMADWRWSRHRPSAWAAAALIATASKGDDDSGLLALINGPEDEVTECAKLISEAMGFSCTVAGLIGPNRWDSCDVADLCACACHCTRSPRTPAQACSGGRPTPP